MAGAFSGHLIDQFNPNSSYNSSIVSHGAMSFNPNMHGTQLAQQSFSLFGSQSSSANDSISEETAKRIATLQVKLNRKLGPEYISQRPGPGGGPKLTYVEGWKVINLANEVFGFNGWSSSIVSLTIDFLDCNEETRRYTVGVTAIVRVTLRDGVFHEDVGYGMLENGKGKGAALDKCKKEAVTDGLKRALRNFGNVLGNCLYDKSYTAEIVKIKVEQPKLNKEGLHRRPEFEDVKPKIACSNPSTTTPIPLANPPQPKPANPNLPNSNTTSYATPSRPPGPQSTSRAHTSVSVPSNPRSGASSNANSNMSNGSTTSNTTMSSSTSAPSSGSTSRSATILNAVQHSHQQPQQQPDKRVSFASRAPTSATSSTTPTTISTATTSFTLAKPPTPITSNLTSTTSSSSSSVVPKTTTTLKAESQDSDDYGFDDDEFAAMAVEADLADLGQPIDRSADLGQPIGDEDVGRPLDVEDVGRPIDMEEGRLASPADEAEDEDASGVVGVHPQVKMLQQQQQGGGQYGQQQRREQGSNSSAGSSTSTSSRTPGTGLNRSVSRDEQIKAALNGPVSTGASSSSGSSSTGSSSTGSMRPPPPPGPGPISGSTSSSSRLSISSSSSTSMTPSTSGSWAQTRHQQYSDKKQLQNQNVHPTQNQGSNSAGSSSMAGRPGTGIPGGGGGLNRHESGTKRSMGGGFTFPPGVSIPALTSTPIIGVKRSADAISSYSSSSGLVGSNSKGRPGMGLHNQNLNQQAGGHPQQQRQVLGSLEVGEGGDVKRIRR